ncbi:MAG: flagellar biosynthetic protein FliR, partial [Lachnospiraceae bacterium]|nr:flagellar biosynthetic protein FliR [Lachnospiraceae bacterium]
GAVLNGENMVSAVLLFLGDFIIIGFRICLPVFCTILLLNAILGILAKASPQLNMFSVGIQLKVLTGLAVMVLTASLMSGAADFVFREIKKVTVTFVEGMM